MRPTQYFLERNNYPLLIGLAVLLLPYIWGLFVLPFRLYSFLRPSGPFGVSESSVVVKTSSTPSTTLSVSSSSIVRETATSRPNRFNIWKGVKELVRPKWENPPEEEDYTVTPSRLQVAGKTIRTTTTKIKTVTTPSLTTVRDLKTVTKSFTQTRTETETETIEVVVEKVIQTPAVVPKLDENSVVLDEIDIMGWHQTTFTLASRSRGCYLITDEVVKNVPEIKKFKVGLLHLFIQHTSAGLSVNENWDSDVRKDMIDALDKLAPANAQYRHNAEGSDDMPAHIKSVLTGSSITVPISGGKLALGTWQGIYLCEFRTSSHRRTLVATIQGE